MFIIHIITNAECSAKTAKEYAKNGLSNKDAMGIIMSCKINVKASYSFLFFSFLLQGPFSVLSL